MKHYNFINDIECSSRLGTKYWAYIKNTSLNEYKNLFDSELTNKQSSIWSILFYNRKNPFFIKESKKIISDIATEEKKITTYAFTPNLDFCNFLRRSDSKNFSQIKPSKKSLENKIRNGISLIKQFWPEAYKEYDTYISKVCVCDSGKIFSSCSDPKLFGLIFLDSEYYACKNDIDISVAIIHEVAHHSFYVFSTTTKYLNDPKSKHYSAFRKEFRPAIGVFHSAIALARMLLWLEKILSHEVNEHILEVKVLITKYKQIFSNTLIEVECLSLTEYGAGLFNDLIEINNRFLNYECEQ